jgi:hypothetical protein
VGTTEDRSLVNPDDACLAVENNAIFISLAVGLDGFLLGSSLDLLTRTFVDKNTVLDCICCHGDWLLLVIAKCDLCFLCCNQIGAVIAYARRNPGPKLAAGKALASCFAGLVQGVIKPFDCLFL